MKKRILALLLLAVMILAGCGGNGEVSNAPESNTASNEASDIVSDTVSNESSESIVSDEVSDESSEPVELGNRNILTGLYNLSDEAVGKRPVAIMVNNIPAAMPQYGIDKAEVVFEIPVEGHQTRLMCLYGDYTQLPQVCSVRSCRKYFPAIALGFDAIYVNYGQNPVITSYVNSLGIVQYDGSPYGANLFIRDKDRLNAGYAIEHTLYFDGPNFPAATVKHKTNMDLAENKQGTAFKFPENADEQIIPEGEACTDIYIDFGANESGFTYNEETKTYFKTFYNSKKNKVEPQVDGKSGIQFEFKNVIVLHTPVAYDPDAVYSKGQHRLINWKGGKNCEAYYISNGVKQRIYWVKNSEKDSMKFYDMDGNELTLNCGKTYICFNEMKEVTFK